MPEFTDFERRQAQEYVEGLLDDRKAFLNDLPEGFSLADVQDNAERFKFELRTRYFGDRHPAAFVDGELIPLALEIVLPISPMTPFGHRFEIFRNPFVYQYWREIVRGYREAPSALGHLKIEFVSKKRANEAFLTRATEFLATRLAWVRDWFGSGRDGLRPPPVPPSNTLTIPPSRGRPPGPVPGCSFLVSTNTDNLRVHWSGAYFLSPNYFGHPTSPTRGTLQAGTYVFGVDGGAYGQTVQWDVNSVCSLPGLPSVHLNY